MITKSLGELLVDLRNETRSSSNTSRGTDYNEYLKQLIRRHNYMLTDDYDWNYMKLAKGQARKSMEAGSRYYDFPTKLDTGSITRVWYRDSDGTQWRLLEEGIGPREYSEHDSDADDRSDVILKWQFRADVNDKEQFEVWPLPASNNGEVWFEGRRITDPLTEEEDICDHDALLIVLLAASEVLAAKSKKDAEIKAAAANKRLSDMRKRYGSKKKAVVAGSEMRSRTQSKRRRVLVAQPESST